MDDKMATFDKKLVVFMAIIGYQHPDQEKPQIVYALILEPCDGSGDDRNKYRRIGLCHLNRKTYVQCQPNETDEEHLITII
jgi:hypothetical protein